MNVLRLMEARDKFLFNHKGNGAMQVFTDIIAEFIVGDFSRFLFQICVTWNGLRSAKDHQDPFLLTTALN